jgi:WhiB family transcriptional regulator, redox-sensing transcriptional regulator
MSEPLARISARLGRCDDGRWRDLAACAGRGTVEFFPVGHTRRSQRQERAAKAICGACPVREECLDFALVSLQNDGIWGGLNEDELRSLRRSRRRTPRRLPTGA